MPELPDVEVFRQYVDSTSLNQEIDEVRVLDKDVLGDDEDEDDFGSTLEGDRFVSTDRRGKYLFLETDGGRALVMHFGMSGYLKYRKREDKVPLHSRVRFDFTEGSSLFYISQRKLGLLALPGSRDRFIREHAIGPDVLSLDREEFAERLLRKNGMVKTALMEQSLFSGIGNIYSDEILFQARIHPRRKVNDLSKKEITTLYRKTGRILETAIDRMSKSGSFPAGFLLPRRHEGEQCPYCEGTVTKIKVAGRGCFICPSCQKENP